MFAVVITGPPGAGKTSVLTALVERIIEREPANWSGLAGLVEHTQVLAATMPALQGVDLVISTEARRPEDAAARIRAALPGQVAVPGPAKGLG